MAQFADLIPDTDLMNSLGDDITYQYSGGGSIAIKAYVERDVEQIGGDGYTTEKRTEVELLKSDLASYPKRGDHIIAEQDYFEVSSVISDDGKYVNLAVKT